MPDRDGYCEHGTYVGGCGIDWMCGPCEHGIPQSEIVAGQRAAAHAEALNANDLWDIAHADMRAEYAEMRAAIRTYVTGRPF